LHDLLKLRAEKRKAEIGFESQKAREAQAATSQAQEIRRESEENRKVERHTIDIDIRKTRLDREKKHLDNSNSPSRARQQADTEHHQAKIAA
jgi:hypothetical protein